MISIMLDCLAEGMKKSEILKEYPDLSLDDIHAAISFGASLARSEHVTN